MSLVRLPIGIMIAFIRCGLAPAQRFLYSIDVTVLCVCVQTEQTQERKGKERRIINNKQK